MITALIILGYIVSVFVARWLNKISNSFDGISTPLPLTWFVPFLNVPAWFVVCLAEFCFSSSRKINNKFIKWFIGDNW